MPWREQVGTTFRLSNQDVGADKPCDSAELAEKTSVSVGVVSSAEIDERISQGLNNEAPGSTDFADDVSLVSNVLGDGESPCEPRPSDDEVDEFLKNQQRIFTRSLQDFELISDAEVMPAGSTSDDCTVSNKQFNSLVAHSFLTNVKPADVPMPWERGVFREIFEKSSSSVVLQAPNLTVPSQNVSMWNFKPVFEAAMDEISHTAAGMPLCESLYSLSMMNVSDASHETKLKLAREVAVSKWLTIIKLYPNSSEIGRQIATEAVGELAEKTEVEIVEAVLGVRSPNTAIARANPILRLLRWLACNEVSGEVFLSEPQVWRYLKFLKDSEASPTAASSLVSALRYAKYVLGFEMLDKAVLSRRIVGLSDLLLAAKQFLKQALVLTVLQVRGLHTLLENNHADIWDRALAGYTLVALYARARHSDLSHIHQCICDFDMSGGFLELNTNVHKNSRSARKKAMLLPILIPCRGVTGTCWPPIVQSVFKEVGLVLEGLINGPILRPVSKHGGLCSRGITSLEVSRFLNLALHGNIEPSDEVRVTSHSLKATCISWCSKFGLPPSDKAILGRHSSSVNESTAVYERDMSVHAVSLLQHVIDNISENKFFPDAPRSEYFPKAVESQTTAVSSPLADDWDGYTGGVDGEDIKEEVRPCAGVVEISDDSSEDDLSASSDSAMSSASEEIFDEEALPVQPRKLARIGSVQSEDGIFWMHRVSKMVHLKGPRSTEAVVTFACGRRCSHTYNSVRVFQASSMCRLCKKREDELQAFRHD